MIEPSHETFKKLVFLSCLAASSIALAGSWTATGKIVEFRIFNGTQILGTLDGVQASCSIGRFVLSDQEFALKDKVFSMMLAAQVSEKSVQLYETDECIGDKAIENGLRFAE